MSVFDTATKLPTTGDTAKGKTAKAGTVPIKGLRNYLMAHAVAEGYKALATTFAAIPKTAGFKYFASKVGNGKPVNIYGVDGDDEASVQLKRRDTRQPLTTEEAGLLKANDIPVGEIETVPEGYFVNPKYYQLLETFKNLPDDFLLYQQREVKDIVIDDTINAIFTKKEHIEKFLTMTTNVVINGKFKGTMKMALAAMQEFAEAAEKAKKDADEAEKAKRKGKKEE